MLCCCIMGILLVPASSNVNEANEWLSHETRIAQGKRLCCLKKGGQCLKLYKKRAQRRRKLFRCRKRCLLTPQTHVRPMLFAYVPLFYALTLRNACGHFTGAPAAR